MTPLNNYISHKELTARKEFREKDVSDPRGIYFRDATAILHSTPFRRLKHKTQVFFAPSNDHICTRLEHVLHVSSIAVTICRALGLNTDMAWAIGMGHDLGHTPFGHAGEKEIAHLTQKQFSHELHSLRVVDVLYKLNLSYAVRDGIITHCGEKFEQSITPAHHIKNLEHFTSRGAWPATYEGCIVRMADKIAYLGRDYEDAVALDIIPRGSLPALITNITESDTNSDIINTLTLDIIKESEKQGTIGFSEKINNLVITFRDFNYKQIYSSSTIKKHARKCTKMLAILYEHLYNVLTEHSNNTQFYKKEHIIENALANHIDTHKDLYDFSSQKDYSQILIDCIANMTDNFVISSIKDLLTNVAF